MIQVKINVSGPRGSGKSTVIQIIKKALDKSGYMTSNIVAQETNEDMVVTTGFERIEWLNKNSQ